MDKISITTNIKESTKEKLNKLKNMTGYSQGQLIDLAIGAFKLDKKIKLVY